MNGAFYCYRCGQRRCRQCVHPVTIGEVFGYYCVACGGPVVATPSALAPHTPANERLQPRVRFARGSAPTGQFSARDSSYESAAPSVRILPLPEVDADRPQPGALPLLRRWHHILRYPLQPAVMMLLFGLAVIVVLVPLGSLFALPVLFHIVMQTAYGQTQLDPPEITDFFDDVLMPTVSVLSAVALLYLAEHTFGVAGTVVGIGMFPLLMIILAIDRSLLAMLNPVTWLHSLQVMRGTYAAAALAFYAVEFASIHYLEPALYALAWESPIPLLTPIFLTMIRLLPMVLQARILGAACEPYLR